MMRSASTTSFSCSLFKNQRNLVHLRNNCCLYLMPFYTVGDNDTMLRTTVYAELLCLKADEYRNKHDENKTVSSKYVSFWRKNYFFDHFCQVQPIPSSRIRLIWLYFWLITSPSYSSSWTSLRYASGNITIKGKQQKFVM